MAFFGSNHSLHVCLPYQSRWWQGQRDQPVSKPIFRLRYRDDDVHHRNICHSLGGKVFEDREWWQEKNTIFPPFQMSRWIWRDGISPVSRWSEKNTTILDSKSSCGCSWPWSFAGMYVFTVGFHPSSALWADSGQPLLRLGQMDGSCFDHGGFQSMACRARGKAIRLGCETDWLVLSNPVDICGSHSLDWPRGIIGQCFNTCYFWFSLNLHSELCKVWRKQKAISK